MPTRLCRRLSGAIDGPCRVVERPGASMVPWSNESPAHEIYDCTRNHVAPPGPSFTATPKAVSSARTRSLSGQSFAARAAERAASNDSTRATNSGSSAGEAPATAALRPRTPSTLSTARKLVSSRCGHACARGSDFALTASFSAAMARATFRSSQSAAVNSASASSNGPGFRDSSGARVAAEGDADAGLAR